MRVRIAICDLLCSSLRHQFESRDSRFQNPARSSDLNLRRMNLYWKRLARGVSQLSRLLVQRQRRLTRSLHREHDQAQLSSSGYGRRTLRPIHLDIQQTSLGRKLKLCARAAAEHPAVTHTFYFEQRSVVTERNVRRRDLAVSIYENR